MKLRDVTRTAGSRFCNKCGTPVSGESAEQARFASPESYTPKHLAEKILTSKAARHGDQPQDREGLGLTIPQSLLVRADQIIE